MKYLKSCDLLGQTISFRHDSDFTLKSTLGGLLSVIVVILTGLALLGFGDNFFYKLNPIFIKEETTSDIYPTYTVNNKNFSLAFRIENDLSEAMTDTTYVFYQVQVFSSTTDENGKLSEYVYTDLNIVNCTDEHFSITDIKFSQKKLHAYFCPEIDIEGVGGFYDNQFLKAISISVKKCNSTGTGKDIYGNDCKSEEEINSLIEPGLYLTYFVPQVLISPSNYYLPITDDLAYNYILLDSGFYKRYDYYIKLISVISDYGWLLESKYPYSRLTLDYVLNDFYTIQPDSEFSILDINFYFNKKIDNYNRTYEKLQTLFAKVGGVINFIFIIARLLIQLYNNTLLEHELYILVDSGNDFVKRISKPTMDLNPSNLVKKVFVEDNKVKHTKRDALSSRISKNREEIKEIDSNHFINSFIKLRTNFSMKESKNKNIPSLIDLLLVKYFFCCNSEKYTKIRQEREILSQYLEVKKLIKNSNLLDRIVHILFDDKQREKINEG